MILFVNIFEISFTIELAIKNINHNITTKEQITRKTGIL